MKTNLIICAFMIAAMASCSPAKTEKNATGNPEIQASESTAVVDTESGKVAGYVADGIHIYKGIPYAKAARFMAPEPADKWDGVRSCRHYGPTSPQGARQGYASDETAFAFDWDDGYTGEDCQRVNIWTPGINDGKKRPVMVWLHGGGYSAGSGQELPSYDGTNLARKGDVVVVTLNHRLNVLGFLDLSAFGDKYADSGNAGLLDIIAALQWVHNNIGNFGGDPDNVTIFGQSGGGSKVSTLTATPAAAGLFHKAIVQSGSTLRSMTKDDSQAIGIAILDELGIAPAQIEKLNDVPYAELLDAGTRAIARAKADYEKKNGQANILFGWGPNVDGKTLPAHPFDPAPSEQSRNIPMIIGSTINEFAPSVYVPALRNLSEEKVMEMLRAQYGDHTDAYVEAFAKAYPGYKPNDLIDTDVIFRPSAIKQADIKARQGGAPVWMYVFEWQSPVLDGALKATHCMEIPFVFNNADRHASMTGGGADAMALADRMSGAWINFARTGNPGDNWKPYTPEEGATMYWNSTDEVRNAPDRELLQLVDSLPGRRL
ncbi:MAG: carboxylesterase/lipase family protein [Bacteroides sp.]|nr:carboxylesterase/lipase family protein [Bacteroides sp.]MCM1457858.1 carboxylesterase/lipase family protein [Lachnoclostridium sp.]